MKIQRTQKGNGGLTERIQEKTFKRSITPDGGRSDLVGESVVVIH